MPALPEAGAEDYFNREFPDKAQAVVGFGRKERRIHRFQKSKQRRIRAAVNQRTGSF